MTDNRNKLLDTKKVWELKSTSDIDMTTTGSPLNPNNIQLYVKRLLQLENVAELQCTNDDKEILKIKLGNDEEIASLLQELRNVLNGHNDVFHLHVNEKMQLENLAKLIVAKLEHREVTNIFEQFVLPLITSENRNTILDMASGIGRFLGYFSARFEHVIEVDYLPQNISRAKELYSGVTNAEYFVDDVRRVAFPESSVSVVFGNWLLQYLQEDEIQSLLVRLKKWLVPGGVAFFHEGIKYNFEGRLPDKKENPAIFRPSVSIYNNYFLEHGFTIIQQGHLHTYSTVFDNPNQVYWVLQCPGNG